MPAKTGFMQNLGDSILVPSGSTGEVMNIGSETAVVLIAELAPEGAFDDEDATPEPQPDDLSRINVAPRHNSAY
jgi:hypothetical protein